jgi:hypothetical protein
MAFIFRRRAASQHRIDSYLDQEENKLVGSPRDRLSYSSLPNSNEGSVSVLAVIVALAILGGVLGLLVVGVF